MDMKTYGDIEVKKDCKLYDDTGIDKWKCKGLNDLYCKREKCKFYKPRQAKK